MSETNSMVEVDPNGKPTIVLPTDQDMATEPAMTIADAQKALNTAIILLGVAGVKFTPEISGALGEMLPYVFGFATVLYGIYAAHRQGRMTRAVVFSPKTTADYVEDAKS